MYSISICKYRHVNNQHAQKLNTYLSNLHTSTIHSDKTCGVRIVEGLGIEEEKNRRGKEDEYWEEGLGRGAEDWRWEKRMREVRKIDGERGR